MLARLVAWLLRLEVPFPRRTPLDNKVLANILPPHVISNWEPTEQNELELSEASSRSGAWCSPGGHDVGNEGK